MGRLGMEPETIRLVVQCLKQLCHYVPYRKDTYTLSRVTEEERPVCWEMIMSVIVRKIVHVNVYLILNVHRDRSDVEPPSWRMYTGYIFNSSEGNRLRQTLFFALLKVCNKAKKSVGRDRFLSEELKIYTLYRDTAVCKSAGSTWWLCKASRVFPTHLTYNESPQKCLYESKVRQW
jgi:hypothetical protein